MSPILCSCAKSVCYEAARRAPIASHICPPDQLSRRQLWGLVKVHFGIPLAHRSFTPGHSSPLDFLYDALYNPQTDIAAWSCRSGGKTLTASILAAMEFLRYRSMEARVLSGSQDQARNLYRYWARWCRGPLEPLVQGDVRRQLTRIGEGKMEILAASQKCVRGPKVQRLFEDELDEIDPELDQASVGMLASSPDLPARTVYTSTWHRTDGPMSRFIASQNESGVRLHRWNVWEAIARCPPERHDQGRGCPHCPLQGPCLGTEKSLGFAREPRTGIAARGTGLLAPDDVAKAYAKIGKTTWDAEFLCKRPTAAGLVYPAFAPDRHKRNQEPEDPLLYRSIDWGHGVFVCLWIAEEPSGVSCVLDTYRAEEGTLDQHANYILAHRIQAVEATFCDPAGRNRSDQTGLSNVQLFRKRGIPCRYLRGGKLRHVSAGIRLVRDALEPNRGPVKLTYLDTQANRVFAQAMQSYRNRKVNGVWIDEPQDPQSFEHIPDALRYYFINRQGPPGVELVAYSAR